MLRSSDVDLVSIADELRTAVRGLRFSEPVRHAYNPLDYAWEAHRSYIERFGAPAKEVVLLGMNPGPWGMAQTGVPFGEVRAVTEWLGISTGVGRPAAEHPKRPVSGFDCGRSEVSGRRVWAWARHTFRTPDRFFDRFFIANYCPLLFLEESGRNRTPDKLPAAERRPLEHHCDRALRSTVEHLRPALVVGLGNFATLSAERALAGLDVSVGKVLHPSPASPTANRGWAAQATNQLKELGVDLP